MKRSHFHDECRSVKGPETITNESLKESENGTQAGSDRTEIRRSNRHQPKITKIGTQKKGCCEELTSSTHASIQDENLKKLWTFGSNSIQVEDKGPVDEESKTSKVGKQDLTYARQESEELKWKKQDGTGEDELSSDETSEEETLGQTQTSDEEEMSQTETSEEDDIDIDITSSEYDSIEEEEVISRADTSEEEENILEDTSEEDETSEEEEVISQAGNHGDVQKVFKETRTVEETSDKGITNRGQASQVQEKIPVFQIETADTEVSTRDK